MIKKSIMQMMNFCVKNDSTQREACGWHDGWHLKVATIFENVLGGIRGGMLKIESVSESGIKWPIWKSLIKKKFF